MKEKRLCKARGQRMVCGVCGGIAEYFNVDPTLVRLAFLLLAAGWGSGLIPPGEMPRPAGPQAVYTPQPGNAAAYEVAYTLYKRLYEAVKPLF